MIKERKRIFTCVTSIVLLVNSVVSLIGACICLIAKKKGTATVFFTLSLLTGAVGALVSYVIDAFGNYKPCDCCEMCDDIDLCDDFEDEYSIPIDDTVNEDEFKD